MSTEVRDNPEEARYEAWVDGAVAGFAQYRLTKDRISITHTEVDPAREGAGIGSRLARAVLDDARSRRLSVNPICPFIAEYIRRHPDEYLDLVVPALRAKVAGGG